MNSITNKPRWFVSSTYKLKRKHPFTVAEPIGGAIYQKKKRRIENVLRSTLFEEQKKKKEEEEKKRKVEEEEAMLNKRIVEIVKILHKKMQEEERDSQVVELDKKINDIKVKIQKLNEEKHDLVSTLKQVLYEDQKRKEKIEEQKLQQQREEEARRQQQPQQQSLPTQPLQTSTQTSQPPSVLYNPHVEEQQMEQQNHSQQPMPQQFPMGYIHPFLSPDMVNRYRQPPIVMHGSLNTPPVPPAPNMNKRPYMQGSGTNYVDYREDSKRPFDRSPVNKRGNINGESNGTRPGSNNGARDTTNQKRPMYFPYHNGADVGYGQVPPLTLPGRYPLFGVNGFAPVHPHHDSNMGRAFRGGGRGHGFSSNTPHNHHPPPHMYH